MALSSSQLIAFLQDALQLDDLLGADAPLFSSGALDSVAMLGLIAFVEERAGISVRPEDVTLENFDTADRILRYAGERT